MCKAVIRLQINHHDCKSFNYAYVLATVYVFAIGSFTLFFPQCYWKYDASATGTCLLHVYIAFPLLFFFYLGVVRPRCKWCRDNIDDQVSWELGRKEKE